MSEPSGPPSRKSSTPSLSSAIIAVLRQRGRLRTSHIVELVGPLVEVEIAVRRYQQNCKSKGLLPDAPIQLQVKLGKKFVIGSTISYLLSVGRVIKIARPNKRRLDDYHWELSETERAVEAKPTEPISEQSEQS